MNLVGFIRSLWRNSKRVQGELSLSRRTIIFGSVSILSLGIGGGVAYKEWQSQSQHQGQIQINNCFFVPTPSATLPPTIKPTRKVVT